MKLILEKNGFEIVTIKNISTGYLLGHALERLPIFSLLKKILINIIKWTHLDKLTIRLPIENKLILSKKNKKLF